MNYTTISVKKETKKELKRLKIQFETKSMDDLLRVLIIDAKKKYIDEFSKDFRQRLQEKGLTIDDVIKSGREIRKEILDSRKEQ
jgi:predicted CopG family antitoxin